MNLAAVAGLPSRPIASVWYRAVEPRNLPTVLGYAHTRRIASRYYEGPSAPVPFDVLYLAENPVLALFEVEAMYGSPTVPGGAIPNPACSFVIINAHVQLSRVADLTDVAGSHAPLSTTAQELTGDWRGYHQRSAGTSVPAPLGAAPTQDLGAALYATGIFEGFLAISAKLPYQMVLGVFPAHVAPGNFLKYSYQDSAGSAQNFQIP